MKHANALGYEDENICAFMQKALSLTANNNVTIDEYIALTLETGKLVLMGWRY